MSERQGKTAAQLDREIATALAASSSSGTSLEDLEGRLSAEIRALPMGPARVSPHAEWLNLAWRVVRVARGHDRAQRGSSRAKAVQIATRIAAGEDVAIDELPQGRSLCGETRVPRPRDEVTRYLKITQTDGVRYILRVTRETPAFIIGIEVDAEGDEIVPRGIHPKIGEPYHQRERRVMRDAVKKAVEMRMNPTYATLEVVPTSHATKGSASAEIQKLRKDARLWWQIAKAEAKAGFRGSADAMERAITLEKKLVSLGAKPPRRPRGFEE